MTVESLLTCKSVMGEGKSKMSSVAHLTGSFSMSYPMEADFMHLCEAISYFPKCLVTSQVTEEGDQNCKY